MNKKLAQIILRAIDVREDSYGSQPGEGYKLSVEQAVEIACEEIGEPLLARLIYLALSSWWNDTMDWATENIDDAGRAIVRARRCGWRPHIADGRNGDGNYISWHRPGQFLTLTGLVGDYA